MEFSLELHKQTLRGVVENQDAPDAVILVHGFGGTMKGPDNLFVELSEKLQQAGFAVIRFAQRGTAPSDGEQENASLHTMTEDLTAVFKWAEQERGYRYIAVLGESLGGSVVVNAYDERMDAVVLWYPVFDFKNCGFREYLNDFNAEKVKHDGYVEMFGYRTGRQMYQDIQETVLYDKAENLTPPVLILHGDADDDVPVAQSEQAFKKIPGVKELGVLEGASHGFPAEQETVIRLTVEFLTKILLEDE